VKPPCYYSCSKLNRTLTCMLVPKFGTPLFSKHPQVGSRVHCVMSVCKSNRRPHCWSTGCASPPPDKTLPERWYCRVHLHLFLDLLPGIWFEEKELLMKNITFPFRSETLKNNVTLPLLYLPATLFC
jgi:hypothetical protein